ncbi:MAG: MFS transporter [Oscillospiraceae bacterium]|nr:MFS transporter [Oscillospiraceae bacterium]
MKERKALLSPFAAFSGYFFMGYGSWATVNSFWPVFFNSFGYSNTQIGVLSAVGPFSALFGLIFWGARADRAKCRNNVALLMCLILGAVAMLYLAGNSFFYVSALSVIFMFCFFAMTPTVDAMFIEYAQSGKIDYGKGRLSGSFGLAFVPMLPGFVISRFGIRSLFPTYLAMLLIVMILVSQLPKMAGGQSGGKKIGLSAVRGDRQLTGLFCFLFFLHMTNGFYFAFFPVYMDNLGASNLIGLNNLAQFCMEALLIWFLVRTVKRFGFAKLYAFAFALTAARMLLIGSIRSPAALIVVNLFCGLSYSMCMMLFSLFALRTPAQLRTSTQMLNTIVAHSLSRFFGSMIGGALSDVIGIGPVFICVGLFDVLLFLCFALWLKKTGFLRDPVLM